MHPQTKTRKRDADGHTLLQKNNPGKPIVQVPEINTPNTTLIIQLSVYIEGLIRCNLKLPHALTGNRSIIEWWVEFIAPGGAVAIAVAIVVAEEVVAAGLWTAADFERLVDGSEEVFS